ncbi:MAG: hypothetical protein GAK45_01528 [Pseudomonas citronellolis]|nr:MAG: hypothetical protein GAK45_01528 [Pseudomonas citronellolis]
MLNNDILRSLRYSLDIADREVAAIAALAGLDLSEAQIRAMLSREDEPGYQDCPDEVLGRFLDGLIIHRRGRDDSRPLPPLELPLLNNLILKKLRVAFELRDHDLLAILDAAGLIMTKTELNALFRNPEHSNYRPCGDQLLRNFLKGLSARRAGGTAGRHCYWWRAGSGDPSPGRPVAVAHGGGSRRSPRYAAGPSARRCSCPAR